MKRNESEWLTIMCDRCGRWLQQVRGFSYGPFPIKLCYDCVAKDGYVWHEGHTLVEQNGEHLCPTCTASPPSRFGCEPHRNSTVLETGGFVRIGRCDGYEQK